jgi:hypothetical protein
MFSKNMNALQNLNIFLDIKNKIKIKVIRKRDLKIKIEKQ